MQSDSVVVVVIIIVITLVVIGYSGEGPYYSYELSVCLSGGSESGIQES